MIDREYYPLDQAAEIIGCSAEDLLYLGASGKITIHAMTNGLFGEMSKFDATTREIKKVGICRLPDASEIPAPILLALANRQIWYIKTVSLTGEGKFLCTLYKFDNEQDKLFWTVPFALSEKSFDKEMQLKDSAKESVIEIKDFVLVHPELEKVKSLNAGLLNDIPMTDATEPTPSSHEAQADNTESKSPDKASVNSNDRDAEEITEKERMKLLRIIGLLAEALADSNAGDLRQKDGGLVIIGNGEKGLENKTNLLHELLKTLERLERDESVKAYGLGKSTLGDTIKAGIKALRNR